MPAIKVRFGAHFLCHGQLASCQFPVPIWTIRVSWFLFIFIIVLCPSPFTHPHFTPSFARILLLVYASTISDEYYVIVYNVLHSAGIFVTNKTMAYFFSPIIIVHGLWACWLYRNVWCCYQYSLHLVCLHFSSPSLSMYVPFNRTHFLVMLFSPMTFRPFVYIMYVGLHCLLF